MEGSFESEEDKLDAVTAMLQTAALARSRAASLDRPLDRRTTAMDPDISLAAPKHGGGNRRRQSLEWPPAGPLFVPRRGDIEAKSEEFESPTGARSLLRSLLDLASDPSCTEEQFLSAARKDKEQLAITDTGMNFNTTKRKSVFFLRRLGSAANLTRSRSSNNLRRDQDGDEEEVDLTPAHVFLASRRQKHVTPGFLHELQAIDSEALNRATSKGHADTPHA